MPLCIICGVLKTKLNSKNFCNECNAKVNEEIPQNDHLHVIDGNKPLSELSCNDLMEIIKRAVKPIEDKIDIINLKLTKLEGDIKRNTTALAQLKDNYMEQKNKTTSLEADISILKEVIVQQQGYLEKCKSKDLAKNVIISGIPNGGLTINGVAYQDGKDTPLAILHYIGMGGITTNDFEVFAPRKMLIERHSPLN